MTRNENQLTSLPFYTDTKYQDRNKWWTQQLYRLVSPDIRFLPFQIIKDIKEIGDAECPTPEQNYTADWSTNVDGWELEDTGYSASLSVSGGDLILTPNEAGGFIIRKELTSDDYEYNFAELLCDIIPTGNNITYLGTRVGGLLMPTVQQSLTSGVTLSIDEDSTNQDEGRSKYITIGFDMLSFGGGTQVAISGLVASATPYRLYLNDTVYFNDDFIDVDGWYISGTTTAILRESGGDLQLEYNSETDEWIRRLLSYEQEGIEKIRITINGDQGTIRWLSIGGSGPSGSGSLFPTVNHNLTTGELVYEVENNQGFTSFTGLSINILANGHATTNLYEIDFQIDYLCAGEDTALWTEATIINIEDNSEIDVTDYMNAQTEVVNFADYQIAIYKGENNFDAAYQIPPGFYYLFLDDGLEQFYSEVFIPCDDLSEYVKVEWWRDIDLVFDTGRIVYTTGYINTMYLITDIGKPNYLYDLDEEERSLTEFIKKTSSVKVFNFDALVPEAITDVLSRIPNHEYVLIASEDIEYRASKITINEPEWEDFGDLAILPIEFKTNTVISNGTAVAQTVNQLLADPETAINIRGNNRRIYQLYDTLDFDDLYLAADKNTLAEAIRIPLSLITQGLRAGEGGDTELLAAGNHEIEISDLQNTDYTYTAQAYDSAGLPLPLTRGAKENDKFNITLEIEAFVSWNIIRY